MHMNNNNDYFATSKHLNLSNDIKTNFSVQLLDEIGEQILE